MSQALTLARPYARAAFAIARDERATSRDSFALWSQALDFASRVAADPRVAALLGDPRLSHDGAVALLSPEAPLESFTRFLRLLADNRRLALLPEIAGLYEELRAEAERVVKATVASATPRPADELDTIKAALRKRFGRGVARRSRWPRVRQRRRCLRRHRCRPANSAGRVFGFLLAEQFLHAIDHHLRLERLRQHIARARCVGAGLIDRLECAGQQDHGNVGELRPAFYVCGNFIAIALRHVDIREHDVEPFGIEAIDRELPVAHRGHVDVFIGECQLDDALNRDAVIR